MVCIDQDTGEKDEEPFVTLAKTRRIGGRILFGQHATHLSSAAARTSQPPTVRVGDTMQICGAEGLEMSREDEPEGVELVTKNGRGGTFHALMAMMSSTFRA